MTLPLLHRKPRIPTRDLRAIHYLLTYDHPGDLDALLTAHAGAVVSATPEDYARHLDTLRAWCHEHHVMPYALRMTLTLIGEGTFSRTYPLVKKGARP